MKTKAPQTHAAAPILVDIQDIRVDILGAKIGDTDTRAVMRTPGAPRPIRGGHAKGSKAVWLRADVVAFFDQIAKSGKWPTEQQEAA